MLTHMVTICSIPGLPDCVSVTVSLSLGAANALRALTAKVLAGSVLCSVRGLAYTTASLAINVDIREF